MRIDLGDILEVERAQVLNVKDKTGQKGPVTFKYKGAMIRDAKYGKIWFGSSSAIMEDLRVGRTLVSGSFIVQKILGEDTPIFLTKVLPGSEIKVDVIDEYYLATKDKGFI